MTVSRLVALMAEGARLVAPTCRPLPGMLGCHDELVGPGWANAALGSPTIMRMPATTPANAKRRIDFDIRSPKSSASISGPQGQATMTDTLPKPKRTILQQSCKTGDR